jgi:hypothetical protein
MSLAKTLEGIREASAKRVQADRAAIMHRATEEPLISWRRGRWS